MYGFFFGGGGLDSYFFGILKILFPVRSNFTCTQVFCTSFFLIFAIAV